MTAPAMRRLSLFFLVLGILAERRTSGAETHINVDPPDSKLGCLTRPYPASSVPAVRLSNTPRLDSLMRAGNLYLTAQDVIALTIENNIDVEVQRYAPM